MLALTRTAIFGRVHEARPLNEVDHFSLTSHESTSRGAQQFGQRLGDGAVVADGAPLLVPPCIITSLASRAVAVKSAPRQ
jgi:hypothetical protein